MGGGREMKSIFYETYYAFGVDLYPENQEDLNFLVRLGLNHTKELLGCGVSITRDPKGAYSYIHIGKRKKPTTEVKNK
jgi:hypothetical protein